MRRFLRPRYAALLLALDLLVAPAFIGGAALLFPDAAAVIAGETAPSAEAPVVRFSDCCVAAPGVTPNEWTLESPSAQIVVVEVTMGHTSS